MNSTQGQNLLHDAALAQESLDQELYFVPWILVNDVSNRPFITIIFSVYAIFQIAIYILKI